MASDREHADCLRCMAPDPRHVGSKQALQRAIELLDPPPVAPGWTCRCGRKFNYVADGARVCELCLIARAEGRAEVLESWTAKDRELSELRAEHERLKAAAIQAWDFLDRTDEDDAELRAHAVLVAVLKETMTIDEMFKAGRELNKLVKP